MIEIRSYRRVFDLERRIYRIDRLRLNPTGVPVRGVLYLLLAVAATALLSQLPLLGAPIRLLPWYLRFAGLPGGIAALLAMIRIDGRAFHLAASAVAARALQPRWTTGFRTCDRPGRRWTPHDLLVIPDGSQGRPRRMRCSGPGIVVLRRPVRRVVVLAPGERLLVTPRSGRG